MSSPSKRRAAKREWMHKQASECNRLISASRNDCQRRIEDLTRHVPRTKVINRPDGGQDFVSLIEQFPKVREAGEYQKYVMPETPKPMFGSDICRRRCDTIDFKAVYHAIKRTSQYGDAILKWVAWEPVLDKQAQRGDSEIIHKLRIAQSHLQYVHGHTETLALIGECIGKLESQRGDYAR